LKKRAKALIPIPPMPIKNTLWMLLKFMCLEV